MEINELKRKIKAVDLPGFLEMQLFGKSEIVTVWVESKSIKAAAKKLSEDVSLKLTWLENLSAMELNQSLVVSYFIRSAESPVRVVLRAALTPKDAEATVSIDSVVSVWPMAREFEKEISDLFGIVFQGNRLAGRYLLPEDWIGFPLRKSYVFPTSFYGVSHFKPVGHSIPDEFASDFGSPVDTGPGAAFGVEP